MGLQIEAIAEWKNASCDLEQFHAMLASHAFANNYAIQLMHKSCVEVLTDICCVRFEGCGPLEGGEEGAYRDLIH